MTDVCSTVWRTQFGLQLPGVVIYSSSFSIWYQLFGSLIIIVSIWTLSFYYYYYYYKIWMSLVTGLFCLVPLSNQLWSPPLTLQASHCSTFRIMCDVPSIAVFCSESIECFPGIASKFFLKLLVTIPVAPIVTGIIYISGSITLHVSIIR